MVRLTIKAFMKALPNSGGNQSIIAKRLNKGRTTITHFIQKHPEMRELVEAEAERIIDVAENVVDHDITTNKSVDTAKWKLTHSKKGKGRGYGTRQEIDSTVNVSNMPDMGKIMEDLNNERTTKKSNKRKKS